MRYPYEVEERAAIYEYEAGMTREEAEKRAYAEAEAERNGDEDEE